MFFKIKYYLKKEKRKKGPKKGASSFHVQVWLLLWDKLVMVLSTQKASSPWCKYQKTNKGLGEAFHQMEFAANIFLPSPPPQKSQTTTPSSAYVHLETSKKGNPVDQLLFCMFDTLCCREQNMNISNSL